MEAQQAVELLQRFSSIEVTAFNQCNSMRGISKTTQKKEARLVTRIFEAMTGRKPTTEEISAIVR